MMHVNPSVARTALVLAAGGLVAVASGCLPAPAVLALSLALPLLLLPGAMDAGERLLGPKPLGIPVLLAAVVAVLLAVAASSTLWDRDETFYVRAVQEMRAAGAWLVPHYNGEPFLHKPPLSFWLMGLTSSLTPGSDLSYRLPAIGATVAVLGMLALLARRLPASGGPGLVLACFATMPLALIAGSSATTDAVLLAGIVLAIVPWAGAAATGSRASSLPRALLMGAGMGIGMLAKAPLGIAVPGASLVCAWWLLRRQGRPPLWRDLCIATALGAACYLAWAIPTNQATNGQLWNEGIGKHVVGRALAPMESHGGGFWVSLPYYLPVILVACLPWTAFLPAALGALRQRELGNGPLVAIALGWFLPTLVLMSCVATKLPHYILPAVPGLALLLAATVQAAASGGLGAQSLRLYGAGRWILAGVCGLIGLALLVGPWLVPTPGLRAPAAGVGLGFLALPLLVWRSWLPNPAQTCGRLAAGMLALQVAATLLVLPAVEPFKVLPRIGQVVKAASGPEVPVFAAGYLDPGLLVYTGRSPIPDLVHFANIRQWADLPGPSILVAEARQWELAALGDRPHLRVLDRCAGFDYSRGRWIEVVTVSSHLPAAPAKAP